MYSSKMMSVSMRYIHDRMLAEDVLHDAWLKIFENIGSFREQGSLEGWMKRIVANTAINELNRKNRQRSTLPYEELKYEEEYSSSFESELLDFLLPEQLLNALHELPEGYRSVFNLYVFEKMKHQEIGTLLSISENTSKSQLHKARQLLKKKISFILSKEIIENETK